MTKVGDVPRWRESSAYDQRERAVLEYAEMASATPAVVSNALVERLHRYFSDKEMVELAAWVARENLRSRFNAGLGAYVRWQGRPEGEVESPRSFLTTLVVRLCIDQLRSARVRRAGYVGPWLPEPLATEDDDPALVAEMADTLSLAFLVLLGELSPAERAERLSPN